MYTIEESVNAVCLLCIFLTTFGSANRDHESYLGCFYDNYDPVRGTSLGAIRVLQNGVSQRPSTMTIGICLSFCFNLLLDRRYAGLESGIACWCGVEGSQYERYGKRDDNECSKPCPGNTNQTCGGDFRIAVYDLSLIRCQLPQLQQGLVTSTSGDFVPVDNNTTFSCLPGYKLIGSDTVQCIFDDSITYTRWNPGLPECVLSETTTSTIAKATESFSLTTLTTGGRLRDVAANSVIAGATVGSIVLILACVVVIRYVYLRKRPKHDVGTNDISTKAVKRGEQPSSRDSVTWSPTSQNHEYQNVSEANTSANDDKTYLHLDSSSRQPEPVYQGISNPEQLQNSELYTDLDPSSRMSRNQETLYQDVTGDGQFSDHDSEYQVVLNDKFENSNDNSARHVPIPPPVERHEEIQDFGGLYTNVKRH